METTTTTTTASAEMEESETKQRSLGAPFEALNSQPSAKLQFTMEWKELEDHFESTRTALRARFDELQHRVEERRKEAEEGEGYLESVRALIKEHDEELRVKEERYESLERVIREKEREVKDRSRKLSWVEKRIEVKVKEVEDEVKRLESVKEEVVKVEKEKVRFVEVSIAKREEKLSGLIAERRKELELKKCEVVKVEKRLWLVEEAIAEKDKEFDRVRGLIEERRKEVELKEGEMMEVKRGIEERERELKEKEARRKEVEEAIVECCKVLESKEDMVRVADAKREDFCLLRRSMEEWGCKVEEKEREIGEWVSKLELKEKEVESKMEELGLIRKELLDEVQFREKHLDSLEKSLVEWEKDLRSLQKSIQGCSRGSELSKDGRGLQLFMDEHLKRIDSLGTELSAILNESSDPGKLVLDAMQGFYPENRESGFELRVRRRSCILLLEELMRISPQMNPQLKEEAAKLAADWKAKMTVPSDKDFEVLGFLRLVSAYGLTSIYEEKELKRLLSNVSHGLQAAEISLALGITEPGSCIFSPIKIEEPESSVANMAATMSSPNPQSNAATYARNSAANKSATMSSPNPQINAATYARNFAANNAASMSSPNPQSNATTTYARNYAANNAAMSSFNPQSSAVTDTRNSAANIAAISSPNPQLSAATDARNSAANIAATLSSPIPQSSATTDFRYSRGSINEHSSWNLDTIKSELVAVVQSASDPENLVLMMMQTSLVKYWTSTEASLKKGVMSFNISLLKELMMRVSPQVGSHVKEGAKKLGLQWKTKIRADAEHLLEIVAFLLFIVAYGLLPILTGDEIVKFLERLSQHKEAVESLQMYGFRDKILAIIIETLVERKQLFQALGFVFKFKLLDKFTPVRVLKDYVKDASLSETLKRKKSVDEKVEFVDSQIADLRAVLRCTKEYDLESEYPSVEIEVQISELEKLKEICRASEIRLASVNRQLEQSPGKKRSSSTSPTVQQGQQRSKFQRTAEASPTYYKTPNFTPVHLQSTVSRLSSSLAYGNYGQLRAADIAANSTEVDRSSSLAYGNHGQHGQVGNTSANSVLDGPPSLVSEIHGQRGHFGYMAANLAEVNPHFGTIDEVDPDFGVPTGLEKYPFKDFTPFPGRDGPF